MIVLARAVVAFIAISSIVSGCSSRCARVTPEPTAPEPSPPTAPEPTLSPAPEPIAPVEPGQPLGARCGGAFGACDGAGVCEFPADAPCGAGGVAGTCVERPRGCFKDCPGVCGCDGVRHCNACATESRGISVRHAGACMEEGAP